jgi:hypothetical protein
MSERFFQFEAVSREDQNQNMASIDINVDLLHGTISFSMGVAGEETRIVLYIPNHADELVQLGDIIGSAALLWADKQQGYDGFSSNSCRQVDSGTAKKEEGTVFAAVPGVIKWY